MLVVLVLVLVRTGLRARAALAHLQCHGPHIRSITNVAVSPFVLPNIIRAIHGILGRIRQNQLLVARISLP